MLGQIGCFVGLHDCDWEYIAEKQCEQEATCKRPNCGKHVTRTHHNWGESYQPQNSCTYVSVCKRCGKREFRSTVHDWNEWEYKSVDCSQERTCDRCERVENRVEHKWDAWVYDSPTSCLQVRFCRRCNTRETGTTIHKWVNTGNRIQTCSHCGKQENF